MEVAVSIENVSKRFRMYRERNQSLKAMLLNRRRARYDEFWALEDVSLEIPAGSTFGIMGANGSGKSTLLKCIARIYRPTTGRVTSRGTLAALLELGSGFHPELSGRENIHLNGSILGLTRREIDAKFDEIVHFSGVERFIDQPVKNYSSGMYVRLGFSIAINVEPDILLVDEVLAVGDALFQEKCLSKFIEYRASGRTVVLVSHAMETIRQMCDQVAWLELGHLQRIGEPAGVVGDYLDHEYQATIHPVTGGSRHGTGDAVVDRVEILDGRGHAGGLLRTGDPATIRVRYLAKRAVPSPVVGLAVYTLDGVHLFGSNTKDFGMVPDRIEGEGSYVFRIERLPLRPGRFEVVAAITDYSLAHTYDHVRHAAVFDVLHGTDRTSVGPVTAFGKWECEDESSGNEVGLGR